MPQESISNQVEVVLCSAFDGFVTKIRPHRFIMDRVFRGQRDSSWKLCSLWERWLTGRFIGSGPHNFDALFGGSEQRAAFRDHHLEQFRRHTEGMFQVPQDVK